MSFGDEGHSRGACRPGHDRQPGRRGFTGFHLITGSNADKEWRTMLEQWVPLAAHVWGVPLRSKRGLDTASMRNEVDRLDVPFHVGPNVRTALERTAEAGADRGLVAGNLFLVGEARAILTGQDLEEVQGAQ